MAVGKAEGHRDRDRLELLGGFRLIAGGEMVEPPSGSQRVLAYMALQGTAQPRRTVAGKLWPEFPEPKAAASLRSALWRLRQCAVDVIDAGHGHLRLVDDVQVDVRQMEDAASMLLSADGTADLPDLSTSLFAGDLLPDWYEDWLLLERERIHQLRLHALEVLASRLTEARRHADAVIAALAAVQAEPLRESANRVLIEAHIAEGNVSEAVRQFSLFAKLLERELGVAPSERLAAVMRGLTPR